MKKINENYYKAILKFGAEHLNTGVSDEQILAFLEQNFPDIIGIRHQNDSNLACQFVTGFFEQEYFIDENGRHYNLWFLAREQYLALTEIIELEEASKNAKEARTFSTWSIIISITAIFLSVWLSFKTVDVKIIDTQFNDLKQNFKVFSLG